MHCVVEPEQALAVRRRGPDCARAILKKGGIMGWVAPGGRAVDEWTRLSGARLKPPNTHTAAYPEPTTSIQQKSHNGSRLILPQQNPARPATVEIGSPEPAKGANPNRVIWTFRDGQDSTRRIAARIYLQLPVKTRPVPIAQASGRAEPKTTARPAGQTANLSSVNFSLTRKVDESSFCVTEHAPLRRYPELPDVILEQRPANPAVGSHLGAVIAGEYDKTHSIESSQATHRADPQIAIACLKECVDLGCRQA